MNCLWHLKRVMPKLGVEVVDNPAHADIVHGHAFDGSPNVYTSHGVYPPEHKMAEYNVALYRNIVSADVVSAVSHWTAKQFEHLNVEPVIIPNGVDAEYLSRYHSTPGDYILWGKNTADEISNAAAFVSLARSLPRMKFVMTVAPQGAAIPTNIKVIGPQPYEMMMQWIAGAAAYVSTGTENMPIQVIEAMALRVPVIALPRGGVHEVRGIYQTEDLSAGLEWVLSHRDRQVENGLRAVDNNYTWEIVGREYIKLYEKAMNTGRSAKVSVVIPCYKLAHSVGKAVNSCLKQSVPPDEIIVVDDGSPDGVSEALSPYKGKVKIIKQSNQGVSAARNNGIKASTGEFICCLDADDELSPDFIERTRSALISDYRVGIAYTGITFVGRAGRSDYPGEAGNLKKLARGNFIPCANLFRKKAWRVAGGYKNINPSWEDYDLWLSIVEAGFDLKWVKQARLLYSAHDQGRSGQTSRENHDKLLRATVDGYHPRLYGASGLVTFVIPCYNQWQYVYDAVSSAWSQIYPHVEVIVIDDKSTQDQAIIDATVERLKAEFPQTQIVWCNENGGLSFARNVGIRHAQGRYVVPLDADDKVDPEFVSECLKVVYNTEDYAYTDVYVWHNEGKGKVELMEMPEFDPARMTTHNQHLCTIMVEKRWLIGAGLYDENMKLGWEDYEMAIRLVKSGHCGKRVSRPLFYYRWRPNSMRQDADTKKNVINRYLWDKHKDVAEGATIMCCGGRKVLASTPNNQPDIEDIIVPEGKVLLRYSGIKKGDMRKTGANRTVYTYSADHPMFLVNEGDLMLFSNTNFQIAKRYQKPVAPTVVLRAKEIAPPPDVREVFPEGDDDLTQIDGIDAEKQAALKAAGINTYQRIVVTPGDALDPFFTKTQARKVKKLAMELLRQGTGV